VQCALVSNIIPRGSETYTSLSLKRLQEEQPINGLPANSNVTLQYVGLGVGVQNYTCASTTTSPIAVGAIATLFDITDHLKNTGDVSDDLSSNYLRAYEKKACVADAADLSDNSCEESINHLHLHVLGKHYFASIGGAAVPSFDIHSDDFLSAQKVGDVPAPADAYDGQNAAGAVDWIFLTTDGSPRSIALSEVYRVNTAGGVPGPSKCKLGATRFSVKYVAQYWFYK
jgi:hypothetical protein